MKKIQLFAFLIFVFNNIEAQKHKTDLFKMTLKGKVKKITIIKINCPMVTTDNINYNCNKDTIIYNFNKKGNLIAKNLPQYDSIKKTKKSNLIIVSNYRKNSSGILKKATEEFYDRKNRMIKQMTYYIHGNNEELLTRWEYFYKNRKKNKQVVTEWWNGNKKTRTYFFNKKGDIIKEQFYRNDKFQNETNFRYEYRTDKKGNWVLKNVYGGQYRTTEKRKFVYY